MITLSTYAVRYTTVTGVVKTKEVVNVGSPQSALAAFWSVEMHRDGADAVDRSKAVRPYYVWPE